MSGGFGRIDVGNQWSAYFDTFGTLISPTYSLGYYLYSSVGGGPYRTSDTIKYANSFGPVYLELDYRSNDGNGTNAQDKNGYGIGLTLTPMDNLTISVAVDNADNGASVKAVDQMTLADFRSTLGLMDGPASATDPTEWVTQLTTAKTTAKTAVTDAVAESDKATYPATYQERIDTAQEGLDEITANLDKAKEYKAQYDAATTKLGNTDVHTSAVQASVDDVELTGIAVKYSFGAVAVTLGHQEKEAGDAEVDTDFVNLSGNISEKTNWLVMLSQAENQDGLETDQVLWGIYHNLGGGLRLYYEATTVEDDDDKDISHHLLGMRVDF